MSTSNTITKNDLQNIINAIFPATTEDMTQAQISTFISSLNISSVLLSQFIITDTFDSGTVSWSAGTVGTRATQISTNISKTGYIPIACSVCYASSSTAFMPITFFSNDLSTLYMNFYRADASAHSNLAGMSVMVVYIKSEE